MGGMVRYWIAWVKHQYEAVLPNSQSTVVTEDLDTGDEKVRLGREDQPLAHQVHLNAEAGSDSESKDGRATSGQLEAASLALAAADFQRDGCKLPGRLPARHLMEAK